MEDRKLYDIGFQDAITYSPYNTLYEKSTEYNNGYEAGKHALDNYWYNPK